MVGCRTIATGVRPIAFLIAIAGLLPVAASAAEIAWSAGDRPYLEGRYETEEADAALRAVCLDLRAVEVRLAADDSVGKGEGEKVKLVFKSGSLTATVNGVSRRSIDSEMTGGTELVAQIAPDDSLFKVLSSGKPVQVTGSLKKPVTWPASGMAAAVKAFIKRCEEAS